MPLHDWPTDLLALDLELAKPNDAPSCGSGPFIERSCRAGVGVVCSWGVLQPGPYVYAPEIDGREGRGRWRTHLARGWPGLLTWNGRVFDAPMLTACCEGWLEALTRGRRVGALYHVDLMATLTALAAGRSAAQIVEARDGLMQSDVIERLDLRDWLSGWRLDNIAQINTSHGKSCSDTGLTGRAAPAAWARGERSRVITYCISDVALLRQLYRRAWLDGYLLGPGRRRVEIPREVL